MGTKGNLLVTAGDYQFAFVHWSWISPGEKWKERCLPKEALWLPHVIGICPFFVKAAVVNVGFFFIAWDEVKGKFEPRDSLQQTRKRHEVQKLNVKLRVESSVLEQWKQGRSETGEARHYFCTHPTRCIHLYPETTRALWALFGMLIKVCRQSQEGVYFRNFRWSLFSFWSPPFVWAY